MSRRKRGIFKLHKVTQNFLGVEMYSWRNEEMRVEVRCPVSSFWLGNKPEYQTFRY